MKTVIFLWFAIVSTLILTSEARLRRSAIADVPGERKRCYKSMGPREIAQQFASDSANNYRLTAYLTTEDSETLTRAIERTIFPDRHGRFLYAQDEYNVYVNDFQFPERVIKVRGVNFQQESLVDILILSIDVPKIVVTTIVINTEKLIADDRWITFMFEKVRVTMQANWTQQNKTQVIESASMWNVEADKIKKLDQHKAVNCWETIQPGSSGWTDIIHLLWEKEPTEVGYNYIAKQLATMILT